MEENYVQKRHASFAASHEMSGALMPGLTLDSECCHSHILDCSRPLGRFALGEGQNFVSDVEAEKLLKLEMICAIRELQGDQSDGPEPRFWGCSSRLKLFVSRCIHLPIICMELEVTDIHMDKEPDGVIIYSNGVSHAGVLVFRAGVPIGASGWETSMVPEDTSLLPKLLPSEATKSE
ncbi:Uncharacterized protein Fot_02571 [Forsythia ovata]|uniref:Uncharacterized protein n=1 Tax=Forsythia ovata TaxID=205694 RepID=A0ABD1X780_9LAMI